eukprot:GILI01011520.1.p1 GENE.GILI01011520.1~~GILI01011520.1.p1  ORF type:complete len:151 (-),score=30.26 GILI01011520.1:74-526(-)
MAAKTEEEKIKERVAQGLQQRKHCGLCEQTFFVEELPGAITYKSILELREKWRRENAGNSEVLTSPGSERSTSPKKSTFNRLYTVKTPTKALTPSPSRLYKRVELCIFCMQFFDVDGVPPAASPDSPADAKNTTVRSNSPRNANTSSGRY